MQTYLSAWKLFGPHPVVVYFCGDGQGGGRRELMLKGGAQLQAGGEIKKAVKYLRGEMMICK